MSQILICRPQSPECFTLVAWGNLKLEQIPLHHFRERFVELVESERHAERFCGVARHLQRGLSGVRGHRIPNADATPAGADATHLECKTRFLQLELDHRLLCHHQPSGEIIFGNGGHFDPG